MNFDDLPIEDDLNELGKYSSVVQRYYTPRYCMNVTEPGDDYCILIHSNRVCLVTLAPSHYIFKQRHEVLGVDFQVAGGVNRLNNKVSGKWKHGAQRLEPQSPLMIVKCTNCSCTLRCGISGKLLEVNQQLLDNPQLLLTDPQGKGFVAIVLPQIPVVQKYREDLLKEDEYIAKCEELYGT